MKIGVQGTFGLDFRESAAVAVDETRSVQICDSNGCELNVELDSRLTANGQRIVAIYVKSWILNYTGLPLRYASGQSGLAGVSEDGIIGHRPCICHSDCVRIQIVGEANMFSSHVEDSEWTRSFNITSIGTTGVVTVTDQPNRLLTRLTAEVPIRQIDASPATPCMVRLA